jgi:hypothetical protein
MDFNRRGEVLWQEWDGNGFSATDATAVVFYTRGHIDIGIDIVLRALASAVQREGIVDSLGQAFKVIKPFTAVCGYSGEIDGGLEIAVCDEFGETYYGDVVDEAFPTTWVEVENIVR